TNSTVTSVGGACGTATGDAATVSVGVTGGSTQNGSAPCTAGAWSFTFATALSADGTYVVTATQGDGAGNTGSSAASTITLDHAPARPRRPAPGGDRPRPHVPVHDERDRHVGRRRVRHGRRRQRDGLRRAHRCEHAKRVHGLHCRRVEFHLHDRALERRHVHR